MLLTLRESTVCCGLMRMQPAVWMGTAFFKYKDKYKNKYKYKHKDKVCYGLMRMQQAPAVWMCAAFLSKYKYKHKYKHKYK